MSLTAGIVGLPNVGKSTLFNAITNSRVEAANYPFATIEPNVGVVEVKDERLTNLSKLFEPERTIYTTFEFTDIAGLVKGASTGEGLGNKFLANIRQVDAICHVVRCFEDSDIQHVYNRIDPIEDIEIINYELIMADMTTCENRIAKVEKKAQTSKDKDAVFEYNILTKVHDALGKGQLVRSLSFSDTEKEYIRGFEFLTSKPVIYIANIKEEEINEPESNPYYLKVKEYAEKEGSEVVAISARIEEELSDLDREEKQAFLEDLGISKSGLDELILKAYKTLGLKTFFTVGKDECRGWTFREGMKAPECAGIIHTDFQRGFIKAEVYTYDDIMEYKSEVKLKEVGRIRQEGKEYLVKDGDVIFFKFNV
ncbi:MAG: redox-regulated ATPase YchF [Erysipelotrichaceae bacterium]|nr:redox-regulated ATPase YchF [Erysipelotrichaceae bacterium]